MRWKMRSRRMPALLMIPSILPKFSTAALTMRSAPAGSATLSPLGTALPPAAAISSHTFCAGVVLPAPSPSTAPPKSLTTTLAPSRAASSAISRPMPPPAPVTRTVLPCSILAILSPPALLVRPHLGGTDARTQQPRTQHYRHRERQQAQDQRHGDIAAADRGEAGHRDRAHRAQPHLRQPHPGRRRAGDLGKEAHGTGVAVGHDNARAEAQQHVRSDNGPPGDHPG